MIRVKYVVAVLILAAFLGGTYAVSSLAAGEGMQTVQGTVICLIPDYAKGTVNPVVATKPCDGEPPHQHIIITSDTVYSLQGLQDGLMKIERNPQRTDVKISGEVKGNENGWILFVN